MAMGLALLWIFLQIDKTGISLFGSLWSIIIAFSISYITLLFGAMAVDVVVRHGA